jgi:murein DD-endopeptidase MepM/ murein hydrolase activator NlpD
MSASSSAGLHRIRRRLLRASLIIVAAALVPAAVSFAETTIQPAPLEASSGSAGILPSAAPMPFVVSPPAVSVPAPSMPLAQPELTPPAPVAPAPDLSSQARDDDADPRAAAIGPLVGPLVIKFDAIWPTRGLITTYYGELGPLSPRGHSGLDIAGPEGSPVLAADQGEVLKAYLNDDGYGGLIIIGHPSGYETWYGHLDSFDVAKGQQVKRGEQIGEMGSTGYSTGPHLHFEVRQDGQLRDPLDFLNEASLKDADW